MNNKRILIIGGAGFIGINFTKLILRKKKFKSVFVLDDLRKGSDKKNLDRITRNYNDKYKFIKEDICKFSKINQIINDYKFNYIVNFASESHVDRSIKNPKKFITTNVMGILSILEAFRTLSDNSKFKPRLHNVSTDEVFGSLNINDKPFDENSPYYPRSPYSASKASSDHIVYSYKKTFGLDISFSNCCNNYGPFQDKEKLIPKIITNCLNFSNIPIYGRGKNIREWIHVDDHNKAIMKILNKKNKEKYRFLIGGDFSISNIKLAKLICNFFNENYNTQNKNYLNLISYVPDRLGHDFRYAINSTKTNAYLNWKPKIQFKKGLQKIIRWYANQKNAYKK
jgi:dTDP-glucose 4,6-dehydratase